MLKEGLKHSIALPFLIFSGIVFVISLKWNTYLKPDFFVFMLFYALVNFKVEATRKHEVIGQYAVGNFYGSLFYTLISWTLLFLWLSGSTILVVNKNSLTNMLFDYTKLPFYLLMIFFVFVAIWFVIIFAKMYKNKDIKNDNVIQEQDEDYSLDVKIKDLSLSLKIQERSKNNKHVD